MLKSIILLVTAIILGVIFIPLGIAYALIVYLFGLKSKREVSFSRWLFSIAVLIDAAGNVFCFHLFNDTFIKPRAYLFGNRKETISSVLGKNKSINRLTWFGRMFSNLLHFIDENHVEKSIDKNV